MKTLCHCTILTGFRKCGPGEKKAVKRISLTFVHNFGIIFFVPRRGGGTGRRSRLKICRWQHRGGSIPFRGTIRPELPENLEVFLCKKAGTTHLRAVPFCITINPYVWGLNTLYFIAISVNSRLCTVIHLDFFEDIGHMVFNCLFTDKKSVGNFPVIETVCNKREYFILSFG